MDININNSSNAHGVPEMLSNILDFFQQYPNGDMLFICGGPSDKNGKHSAITGAIGDLHDIENLIMGMFSTTIYEAYDKSYFEVFLLLKRLTNYTMNHFTEEDKEKFLMDMGNELDRINRGGHDE